MIPRGAWFTLALLPGCLEEDGGAFDDTGTLGTDDTAADDSGTDDSGTDDSGASDDTAAHDDTGETAELVSSLAAAVSDTVGSIVVVTWEQGAAADVHLEFSFEKGSWLSSRTRSLPAGPQRDLILGVPYDQTVEWRLVAEGADDAYTSTDASITTAALPSRIPENAVTVSEPALQDAAAPYWFVGIAEHRFGKWWTIIVDRQGRVVWAMQTPEDFVSMHAHVANDGQTMLLDRNSYWGGFDAGASSYIDEATIDGAVIRTVATPGMHHPFTKLPDGSIAYAALGDEDGDTLEIVHVDGSTESLWSCTDWLESIGERRCDSNTLRYDEATNRFLFSFYNINSIVEIDRDTALVERWWGQVDGAYAFDPPESGFWWQHGGYITSAGTLLTSSDAVRAGEATVVHEYEIDDATQTLREIWSFGVDEGLYGVIMGEATRLPNGNTERNTGALARMQEVTPDGTVVWDIQWDDSAAIGRSTWIGDLYDLAP